MEPPPVLYVTTSDGFRIAYTERGQGRPFVFMPWPVLGLALWRSEEVRPFLDALSARFRLIHYDARGQGMSTRGLPEHHQVQDYLLDLEALVDGLGLEPFVLLGSPLSSHTAVRYAVQHPQRVEALVLNNATISPAWDNALASSELARHDWELFLHTFASSYWIDRDRTRAFVLDRESWNQDDFLTMVRAARKSDIRALLPALKVPTLITASRRLTPEIPLSATALAAQTMASLIPNARLLLFDDYGSYFLPEDSRPPAIVAAIEKFLEELRRKPPERSEQAAGGPLSSLSPRQRQVLQLVAEGKTNREIAENLVLSERTVQRHVAEVYLKIGARNRSEATAFALGKPAAVDP